MAMRKSITVMAFLTIITGALAGSKQSDAEILTRIGRMTAKRVQAVMPDTSALAGPLPGTSARMTVQDPGATEPGRMYRIRTN